MLNKKARPTGAGRQWGDRLLDGLTGTVTDHRLARGIGEALHDASAGALDYRYTKGDTMLRVTWHR